MKNIDIVQLLADLPTKARESVLFSLSGSANASVINTASFMVDVCDREGIDVQEEVELYHFMNLAEMGRSSAELGQRADWFVASTNTVAWANQVRDIFMATTKQPDVGGLNATLEFMSSKPRLMKQTDAQRTADFLNALDDAGITPETVKTIFDQAATQRCHDLATTKHRIALVMHALPAADCDDPFSLLTERQQGAVLDKLLTALIRTRNQLMLSVARPNSNQDIGDYVFVGAAIKQLKAALDDTDAVLKVAGRARADEPCPTAPVHNVVLSELEAQYKTGRLSKPKAVLAVREHMKCSKFNAAQRVAGWPAPKVRAAKRVPATPEQIEHVVTK